MSLNLEQEITKTVGFFARAGVDQGTVEPYEYADIDDTVQAGFSFSGEKWGRKDDAFAIAGVVNVISRIHQDYLNDGGLGILVGDSKLPHPGPEEILEAYYSVGVIKGVNVTFDFQGLENPAYNRDRGPVPVLGVRLHGQF
jgi:high affinity Mn2+ porin